MPFKPTIQYDDFLKLDLRVATVLQAEALPKTDRLLKVQVDLGEEQRQICAGIREYVADPAELVGKQVIVVTNLAPRKMYGEESNGMLLAASVMSPPPPPEIGEGEEGEAAGGEGTLEDIVVLQPSKPTPAGSKVS